MDDKKDLGSSTLNHGPRDWTSSNTKIVFKAHGCNNHGGGGGKGDFFFVCAILFAFRIGPLSWH